MEQIPNSWTIMWYQCLSTRNHTVVIHVGSNDVNDLANRIIQIGLKCRWCGIQNIAILSVLVRNNNNLTTLIQQVKILLAHLCKTYGFDILCNNRIREELIWRDGLHLTDEGTPIKAINFLSFLNSVHENDNLPA